MKLVIDLIFDNSILLTSSLNKTLCIWDFPRFSFLFKVMIIHFYTPRFRASVWQMKLWLIESRKGFTGVGIDYSRAS